MALVFDTTYYLQQNPDVLQAILAGTIKSAEEHFNRYGAFEGRNPNAIFNTNEYLAANPDVLAAGVNAFKHYLSNGVNEGRAPNASFLKSANFDSAAYLAANPDLATAGIDTPLEAYAHLVLFGQFENRPGIKSLDGSPVPGGNAGQAISLEAKVETVSGSSGDDTFTGVIDQDITKGQTLNNGDSINGLGGNDKLVAIVSGFNTVTPTLTNVETVEFQAFAGGGTINLGTSTGVKTVASANSTATATVTNVAALVDASVSNIANGSQLNISYNAATVVGTADVQNVTVTNSRAGVFANGIETLNIKSVGQDAILQSNRLDFNTLGLKTVNVEGDGKISLDPALGATTTVLDASKSTGGVTARFGAAANVTATGGKGADSFNFGATLTKADVVNGGEGIDTVRIVGADYTAAANATLQGLNALTSIERIAFDGNGPAELNGSTFANAGVSIFQINTANGIDTFKNASSTATYEIGTNNAGSLQLELAAGGTNANVTLLGSQSVGGTANDFNTIQTGDGLTANMNNLNVILNGGSTAATTVSLVSTGDLAAGASNTINNLNLNSGSTVTVTGDAAVSILNSAKNVNIDASALTKSLFVNGSEASAASVNTTVAGSQTGVDVITLGSAKDTVTFSNALESGVTNITPSAPAGSLFVDSIVKFGTNDVLDWAASAATFTALSATNQSAISALSGAGATLQAAADIAANANTGAGWTAFNFQGDAYALYEDAADAGAYVGGTDMLVKLTGIDAATLTSANFA